MRQSGLVLAVVLLASPALRAQTSAELAQTAAFVAAHQNPDGGFAATRGGTSSLGATSSAIRALKYTAGSIPDVPACIAYVRQCHDAASGGFAPTPGGMPDVATTASGLMATSELKVATEETVAGAIRYVSEHATGFEDIRIAVAGLEAVAAKSPDFPRWREQVESDRNPDGTWGQGPGKARATGGAAVALLRMGVDLNRKDAIVAALKAGQNPDGGWPAGEGPSDLGSSYRIMRAFSMLGETPDLDRLLAWIARHRQEGGGYGPAPGTPADLGSTYFATIMIRWARLLRGEPPVVETAGFSPLFNGTDLSGWEGDPKLWSARDGLLVGRSPGLDHNDFLATEKPFDDFILKLTFRLVGGEGNSGVQFRSVRVPGHEMSGYQADIGQQFWGCLYDESRRDRVLVPANPRALETLKKDGWNEYVIRAMGDHITLALNGVTSVDYREPDRGIAREGRIAVQIHAGGPMEVQFKDILIQPLPIPRADADSTPGFHLRSVTTGGGERPYTVFLPHGYDGRKAFPVVLFLHGSGERGDDGIRGAQVGLGAIVARRPADFPVIAVFPQARRTWAADSDDARAALDALDDVLATYRVDPERVVLTGLSMGGRGAWELAAAHPGRFSAVVPICGPGRPEDVAALKALPVWTFVGDADRDTTVRNLREMVAALCAAGASARATEYRGVGHNSWDRAYSDPTLLPWMLGSTRTRRP
ncbi:MAG TPA: family 16 glycoside hydrolase [Isosphaeraceae bacterium]|jgi:pimeloyl-ACP methyl ester carboxylesterase